MSTFIFKRVQEMIPSPPQWRSIVGWTSFLITLALVTMAGCNGSRQSDAGSATTPNETKTAAADSERAGKDKKPAEITLTPESLQKYNIKTDRAQAQLFTPT